MHKELSARYWPKVAIDASYECALIWAGSYRRDGYGQLGVVQPSGIWTQKGAHVVAWFIARGVWPEPGQVVRHTCDNPRCVTPWHLELGTPADNSADMRRRGRSLRQEGVRNHAGKLSASDIRAIRVLRADWRLTETVLASIFEVGKSTIGRVRKREVYTYV